MSECSDISRVSEFLKRDTKIEKVKALLNRSNNTKKMVQKRKNPLVDLLGTEISQKKVVKDQMLQLPPESYIMEKNWDSMKDMPLDIPLPGPAFKGNNTLVISATIPSTANRCSFNICAQDDKGHQNILYHFNPRKARGGQIIQNSKIDERWGIIESLPRFTIEFGTAFQLRITLTVNGFAVYIGQQFQMEYQHRIPLKEHDRLHLNLPTMDDYGNQEGVIVHSVWWGHAEISLPSRRVKTSDVTSMDVYVGGINHDTRKRDVEDFFDTFNVENIRLMPSKGFGFVTLPDIAQVERAIEQLNGNLLNGTCIKVSHARGSLSR